MEETNIDFWGVKQYLENDIVGLIEGFENFDGWFLKAIKHMIPVLATVSDEDLQYMASGVLQSQAYMKTYRGLIEPLLVFFGDTAKIEIQNPKPAVLSILVTNPSPKGFFLKVYTDLITKVYEDGVYKIYNDQFKVNGLSLKQFFQRFLLAGVVLEDISIIVNN